MTLPSAHLPMMLRLEKIAPALLLVVVLVVLLPGNRVIPLVDRDEPRFAQATREMVEADDWVVPYFNGGYRLDKPVLIYWMMRGTYAVFGVNEFSARLPSVLSAAALVLLTFSVGARWFSRGAGWAAGFALATCLQMLVHGRSAVADMPMILCVLASHYGAFELLHGEDADRRRTRLMFALLYGGMGLGFLAKGPIALAVPVITLLLYRFAFGRQRLPWRRLLLPWGVPVVLVLVGAWAVPALIRTRGAFLTQGLYRHVFQRGFESFNGHPSSVLYYALAAPLSLFPWFAFAVDTWHVARRDWNTRTAFLVSWIVGTYVLFTLYRTKLPHYVLPAFPAVFLLVGPALASPRAVSRAARWWFCVFTGVLLVLGGMLASAAWSPALRQGFAALRPILWGAAAMIAALALVGVAWRVYRPALSVFGLVLLAVSLVVVGKGLRQVNPAIAVDTILRDMPADTEFGFYRFREPSLVFYGNRRWAELAGPADVRAFLEQPGPRVAVMLGREIGLDDLLREMVNGRGAAAGEGDAPAGEAFDAETAAVRAAGADEAAVTGLNIARTAWVEVRVFSRR